jgi:hypothetical protein
MPLRFSRRFMGATEICCNHTASNRRHFHFGTTSTLLNHRVGIELLQQLAAIYQCA